MKVEVVLSGNVPSHDVSNTVVVLTRNGDRVQITFEDQILDLNLDQLWDSLEALKCESPLK